MQYNAMICNGYLGISQCKHEHTRHHTHTHCCNSHLNVDLFQICAKLLITCLTSSHYIFLRYPLIYLYHCTWASQHQHYTPHVQKVSFYPS